MKLHVIQLLLADEDLPAEARRALAEDRRADAGRVLMDELDLDCDEASELLELHLCD